MIKLTEVWKNINEAEKEKAKPKAKPAAPVAPPSDPAPSAFDKNLAAFTKERPASPAQPLPKTQSDPDFLAHVKHGLGKSLKQPQQQPPPVAPLPPAPPVSPTNVAKQGDPVNLDPDALKAFQKGLSKVDSPAAQSADRIANRMTQRPEKQSIKGSDKPIPSLAQLAKDAEKEEPKPDEEDPALKGLPKFTEPEEENPFGDPHAGQPDDFRTGIQKGASALKKGVQAVGKGIKNLANKPISGQQKSGEVPPDWQPPTSNATTTGVAAPNTPPEDDSPMPSMSNVAKSASKNGLQGKHWQWKPGQKVDIGFVKGLTVLKVDQYGAQLQAKNGGIYRFVPHRGLRKISN